MRTPLSQTRTIPADLTHSAEVRELALQFFGATGFDERSARRLVLVVDELFMNAVKYGCTPGDTVELVFEDGDDGIAFRITDTGAAAISPEALREKIDIHLRAHTPHQTSGRGLAIITGAWVDDYTIERAPTGGITISFFKAHTNTPT